MLNPMESCKSVFGRRASSRAFTIVELLTVMAVIAILSAILLPVLGGVLRSGEQAESLNRMRQIGQWMQLYAQDSNDVVLPSRFDYRGQRFAGKAASLPNSRFTEFNVEPSAGRGTWADILWVRNCQAEADYVTSRRDHNPSTHNCFGSGPIPWCGTTLRNRKTRAGTLPTGMKTRCVEVQGCEDQPKLCGPNGTGSLRARGGHPGCCQIFRGERLVPLAARSRFGWGTLGDCWCHCGGIAPRVATLLDLQPVGKHFKEHVFGRFLAGRGDCRLLIGL